LYRKAKIFQPISPSRENGAPERPQTFRCSEIINILSADYAQSNAERIPNRPTCSQPCVPPHKGVYWAKKEAFAMWFVYALGSAVFAALTSILAKIGIEGVNSTLATAIRTAVVLLMSWGMVFLTGTQTGIADISRRSWLFLVLSGLATGASWLCYYHALQVGAASKVVPIDKLSVVITLALAFVVLHEPFTAKSLIGCALITAGTLFMVL
jgi:transporter family protein